MSEPVIEINNLSKAYQIYSKPMDILKEFVTNRSHHDVFWALRNISLNIYEKQRVGIIGPNGSGKSTLLKIIAGNLNPTSGRVFVNGKISAMLSLNTVLNPEETGLSNIRFNLILNGCKPTDINRLTEEIVDFSELGQFIYAPVKTYSSGMNAKLSFAISTAINPEILIIDEVLGVGDAYFMAKATKRMIDLCNRGKALIFVSHATSAIQMLCDTVVWMDNGGIRLVGATEYVLKQYEEDYRKQEDESTRSGNAERKKSLLNLVTFNQAELLNYLIPVRIVPYNLDKVFHDTHYIMNIKISFDEISFVDVPLEIVDVNDELIPCYLDLLNSEWGRYFEKNGNACRILEERSGKCKGGFIYIKKTLLSDDATNLVMEFEAYGVKGHENLALEYIDSVSGEWVNQPHAQLTSCSTGWNKYKYYLKIQTFNDKSLYSKLIDKIEDRSKPSIEIVNIEVFSENICTCVIKERQPFDLRIAIRANRLTPIIDVGVKIIRSDGVYVFWQSSGQYRENIHNFADDLVVVFKFDNNVFAAGDYNISAYCANGWDEANNYPYSEVYCRTINAYSLKILRENQNIDYGQVNMIVPVEII